MENEVLNVTDIRLGDIQEIDDSSIVPPGRYIVRLNAVDPKVSQKGNPMVVAKFLILEGDYDGTEVSAFYTLRVTKSQKNGKLYSPGIIEMKKAFAAIGEPLSDDDNFSLDPLKAAQLFGKKLHPRTHPRIEVLVTEQADKNDPKKKYTRVSVQGKAASPTIGAGAETVSGGKSVLDTLA